MTTPTSRDVLEHTGRDELIEMIQKLEAEREIYTIPARSLTELQELVEQMCADAPPSRIHPNH